MGMVSLSLPTIPRVGEQFVGEKEPLLYVRWHERVYEKDDIQNTEWWSHERHELKLFGRDMKDSVSWSTGSQFFHKLVYRYEQERAKRTQPKNKWAENDGLKLYPTFEWTSQGDLLLNTVNVDAQRQVARVLWGKILGPENGMDRRSLHGQVSLGTKSIARISFGHDSHPVRFPRGRQPTYLLESGWYVFGVECHVQLAFCEFERKISSLGGVSLDASLARVLRCRHQQHGEQSHHGSLTRNQVPPSKHHPL